jgi:hypothetical protein
MLFQKYSVNKNTLLKCFENKKNIVSYKRILCNSSHNSRGKKTKYSPRYNKINKTIKENSL